MTNNQPLVPKTKDRLITAIITTKEANLLNILRQHAYGKFIVYKTNNRLVRIEINDSKLIVDDEELMLAIKG